MKIRALILAFVFLFAGSGTSIDIATCCSKLSGFSIGLGNSETPGELSCCARIAPVKKKPCCEDIEVKMVINPVLALAKTAVYSFKTYFNTLFTVPVQPDIRQFCAVYSNPHSEGFDHHYPIPILKRKRVLQI